MLKGANHLKADLSHKTELTHKQNNEVQVLMYQTNYNRGRIMYGVAFFIEILLIYIFDMDVIQSGNLIGTRPDHLYLYSHVSLLLISVFNLLVIQYTYPKENNAIFRLHHGMLWVTSTAFLSIVALITGLDQLSTDSIASLIIVLMIGSFYGLIKPPFQVLAFAIPGLIMVFSVHTYQVDPQTALINSVNGFLFVITMCVLSAQNYNSVRDQFVREVLLRENNEQLDFLAHHDYLTGLYNRRSFEKEMVESQLSRLDKETVVLVLMDLDHFKKVNDKYGHAVADDVLIHVSKILQSMAGPQSIVSRWGGEEFIFLLHGQNQEVLLKRIEEIRQSVELTPCETNNDRIAVTGSFGVTFLSKDSPEKLNSCFKRVDEALYGAKRGGRNCVWVR